MGKLVILNGKKVSLSISIDDVSLDIYVDNGDYHEPTYVCYWHIEEIEEDATVAMSMLNAVILYYTDAQKLVDSLKF